jgi:hypothetical protein
MSKGSRTGAPRSPHLPRLAVGRTRAENEGPTGRERLGRLSNEGHGFSRAVNNGMRLTALAAEVRLPRLKA